MILQSLKTGFARMWQNKRMLWPFFLANFVFGMILMLPFRAIVDSFAGRSLMGGKLAAHMDMDFVFDLLAHKKDLFSVLSLMVFVVPLVYWLINLFLSGGAFAVFTSGNKYERRTFWGGAANHFGRFVRLSLWSIPVLAILFAVQFLEPLFLKIAYHSDAPQNISYWGGWVKFGIRTLSLLIFAVIFDYARILTVVQDERKMIRALWRGIKFTFGNFAKVFTLAFLFLIVGSVVLVVYNPVANALSAANAMVVLLLFLLQQLYMFWRMALRLSLFAGEVTLFGLLQPGESPAAERLPPEEALGLEGAPA